jgi:hypothetical protein
MVNTDKILMCSQKKKNEKPKCFIVDEKDVKDPVKNPSGSDCPCTIIKNNRIPKTYVDVEKI